MKKFAAGLIIGLCLAVSVSVYAEEIQEYVLSKIQYPVIVNQAQYESEDQPVLNYKGHTYIPLRAVGTILNADVRWNQDLFRVEIKSKTALDSIPDNEAFRHLSLKKTGDYSYEVSGEARVFEAVFQYALSNGSEWFEEKPVMTDEGAPAWSEFTLEIEIPESRRDEAVTLELFVYSAKDGSKTRTIMIPLNH